MRTILLYTIYDFTDALSLLAPPPNTPGFYVEALRKSLNCSHCIPTCYETEHDLEIDIIQEARLTSQDFYGHIDVTYGELGAKKYQRDITFTWTDLLGEYNGVCVCVCVYVNN